MKILIAVVVVVVVLVGGVVGVGMWMQGRAVAEAGKAEVVRLENPARGDVVEIVSAPGEIEPKTKVSISARVVAQILELPFKEGDRVTKGDPNADPPVPPSLLVRLDASDLEAGLRSAEARRAAQAGEIKVAEARIVAQQRQIEGLAASLRDARRALERSESLFASGDVSESDHDQARCRVDELISQHGSTLDSQKLNLDVIRYRLAAADAEITQAREQLKYTSIVSPIDGVITRLNAEVGEVVMTGTMNNAGTVILEVADLSQMLVVASVDEADVGALEVGQRACLDLRAYPDEKLEGVVDTIALVGIGPPRESKEFRVEILLDSGERKVYSGLNADAEIETHRHENVLKVPSQAVLGRRVDDLPAAIRDDNPCVDVKKTFAVVVYRFQEGKAVVTPVTVGASDQTHTVIEAGLTESDRVVVGPYKVLEDLKHDQKIEDEKAPASTQPAAKTK